MSRKGLACALLAAAVACALLSGAQTAGATSSAPPMANLGRIVAPQEWELVTGGRLHPVIRPRRGASVRAWVEKREITRSLRRRRNGTMVGSIAPGRRGLNRLYVSFRRGRRQGWRSAGYVVGRRVRSFMTVSAPRGLVAGPVRVGVRLRRHTRWLSIRLNGRNVTRAFYDRGRGARREATLALNDGLRVGRNALRVVAYRADGTYDVERRTLRVRADRPLVGAPDVHLSDGRLARMRARALGPGKVRKARFRWRIIKRPRGSRVRLARRLTATPTLVPDRPGTYRLAVTATTRAPSADGGQASSAADIVTLTDPVDAPPIGPYLNTRAGPASQPFIEYGHQGESWHATCPASGQQWQPLQLMTIERDTGAATCVTTQPATVAGWQAMAAAANGPSLPKKQGFLAIFSMPQGAGNITNQTYPYFKTVMAAIGGPSYSFDEIEPAVAFSAVGSPGWPEGAATVNLFGAPSQAWKTSPGPALNPGAVTGYVQDVFQFIYRPGDYLSFDTQASGSNATTNVMTVGEMSPFSSGSLPAGAAGFQVVVLDAWSLQPKNPGAGTLHLTNGAPGQSDQAAQQAFASYLQGLATDPKQSSLVLIQSVGSPKATTSAWDSIAQQIQALGGTRTIFNCLNLTTEQACQGPPNTYGQSAAAGAYALVGGAGITGAVEITPAEVDNNNPATPVGSLSGVLGRDQQMRFTPAASDPLGKYVDQLQQLAYQDPVDWPSARVDLYPNGDTACQTQVGGADAYAEQVAKANAYITNTVLGLKGQGSDLRTYYSKDLTQSWGGNDEQAPYTVLSNQEYPGDGEGFAECVWDDLKGELLYEFGIVDGVKGWFAAVIPPFEKQGEEIKSYLDPVAQTVQAQAHPPDKTAKIVNDVFTIAGDIANIASSVLAFAVAEDPDPKPTPPAENTGKAAGAAGAIFQLVADVTEMIGGPKASSRILVEASQLEDELFNMLANSELAITGLEQIVISDYGKLTAAFEHTKTDPQWTDTDQLIRDLQNGLQLSTARNFYASLLPLGFKMESAGSCTASNTFQQVNGFTVAPQLTPISKCWKFDKGNTSLTDPLFTTPVAFGTNGPTALGMNRVQFDTQTFNVK